MKLHFQGFVKLVPVLLLTCLISQTPAYADKGDVRIQKLFLNHRQWAKSNPARSSGLTALQEGLGGLEHSSGRGKWAEIKVTFDTKPRWADEITFKAMVYLKNKKSTVLSGEVTYINIPKGQKHTAVLYIHPLTLQRYGEVKKNGC